MNEDSMSLRHDFENAGLRQDRPYRPPMDKDKKIRELEAEIDRLYQLYGLTPKRETAPTERPLSRERLDALIDKLCYGMDSRTLITFSRPMLLLRDALLADQAPVEPTEGETSE